MESSLCMIRNCSAMADSESGRIELRRETDEEHLLSTQNREMIFSDSNEIHHYGHH